MVLIRHITRGPRDHSPYRRALGRHVGLAKRERVDVRLVLEARQAVVHEPVRALVAPHGVHDVKELGVLA